MTWKDIIPKNNWLTDYVTWTSEGEVHEEFNLFNGFIIIASILTRQVWVDKGYPVYPNLYVVLTSPSGVGRKSTSIRFAARLLQRLAPGLRARLQMGRCTPEAVRQWLTRPYPEDSPPKLRGAIGTILADEMAVFFGKQKYNVGMVPLLTKLYDCPNHYEDESVTWKNIKLENVWLSLMATTTPDWLRSSVTEDATTGGFTSRCLYVWSEQSRKRITKPPKLNSKLEEKLYSEMIQMTNISGEFILNKKAMEVFDDWYQRSESTHSIIPGYYERRDDIVLKLAVLLLTGDYDYRDRIIKPKHITEAIQVCNYLEPGMVEVAQCIALNPASRYVDEVLGLIRTQGLIHRRELVEYMYRKIRSVSDLDTWLDILIARGLIQPERREKSVLYKYTGGNK